MNTQYVKKQAICKALGEIFANTCKYDHLTLNRWNEPIEPDESGLIEFRLILCHLAEKHFYNSLSENDVNNLIEFVRKVGFEYGHVTGSYLTGTWGVRTSELNNIIDILRIPEFELLPVNSDYKIYDLECKIESYQITDNYLWVKLDPINPEVRSFEIDFTWKNLLDSNIILKG